MATDNSVLRNYAFEAIFQQEWQQNKSALRNLMINKILMNEYYKAFSIVGAVASGTTLTPGAHAATTFLDHATTQRGVKISPYTRADLIDDAEKVAAVADPTNEYMLADLAYFERCCDAAIIAAFDGTATTGATAGGTEAYDTDMDVTSSGSLTYLAILEAKENMNANSVPRSNRCLIIGEDQETDLFQIDEFISGDYNIHRPIYETDSAIIGNIAGFTVISMAQSLLGTTGGYNKNFYFHKDAMAFAIGGGALGFWAKISENPSYNFETQLQTYWNIGASRFRETGVGRILV